jgi:hypothetical protein
MVDEAAALDREIAPFRPKITRLEDLKKAIRLEYEAADANTPHVAPGVKFCAVLGPKASQATIDISHFVKLVGMKAALGVLSCTLKALDAFPAAIPLVVTRANTGTRSLEFYRKEV